MAFVVAAAFLLAYYFLRWDELLVSMVFAIAYSLTKKRGFAPIFVPLAIYFVLIPLSKKFNVELPLEVLVLLFSFALLKVSAGKYQKFVVATSVLMLLASGYLLSRKFPLGNYLLYTTLAIAFAIVLTVLLPEISERFESLRYLRGTVLVFLLTIAIYYNLRQLIPLQPLRNFADWVVVSALVLKSISSIRSEISEDEIVTVRKAVVEETVEKINDAEKRFIEFGEKSTLIFEIAKALFDAGLTPAEVSDVLSPLVNYSDKKVPKLAFSWEKERILKKNRKSREKVVFEVKKKLEEVG